MMIIIIILIVNYTKSKTSQCRDQSIVRQATPKLGSVFTVVKQPQLRDSIFFIFYTFCHPDKWLNVQISVSTLLRSFQRILSVWQSLDAASVLLVQLRTSDVRRREEADSQTTCPFRERVEMRWRIVAPQVGNEKIKSRICRPSGRLSADSCSLMWHWISNWLCDPHVTCLLRLFDTKYTELRGPSGPSLHLTPVEKGA